MIGLIHKAMLLFSQAVLLCSQATRDQHRTSSTVNIHYQRQQCLAKLLKPLPKRQLLSTCLLASLFTLTTSSMSSICSSNSMTDNSRVNSSSSNICCQELGTTRNNPQRACCGFSSTDLKCCISCTNSSNSSRCNIGWRLPCISISTIQSV